MSEVSREGRKDFFSWALRLRARPVVSARSPFTPPKSWKNSRQRQPPPSGGGMFLRGQKVLCF